MIRLLEDAVFVVVAVEAGVLLFAFLLYVATAI